MQKSCLGLYSKRILIEIGWLANFLLFFFYPENVTDRFRWFDFDSDDGAGPQGWAAAARPVAVSGRLARVHTFAAADGGRGAQFSV